MIDPPPISPLLAPRSAARALVVGGAALVACAAVALFDAEAAARAYLVGFALVISIPLGCLGLVMLHHLTGGAWGRPVRRLAEAAALTFPLLALLFLPVAVAMLTGHLYPWADARQYDADAVLRHRRELPLLGFAPAWVLLRAAGYFAVWSWLAWRLRALSLRQDAAPSAAVTARLRGLSAGGMLLFFLTASLAAADWVMSREAHYYSSVFGFIAVSGHAVAGLVFLLVVLALLARRPPLDAAAGPGPLNDLANLLMTVVVLWAYTSFAQLLINWLGNTQEETTWYVHRSHGGWRLVSIALVVLHFGVPFAVLLFRRNKRTLAPLARLAAGLLVLRWVDALWTIAPSSPTEQAGGLNWADLFAPVGVGGVWLAGFLWALRRAPVMIASPTDPIAPAAAPLHA